MKKRLIYVSYLIITAENNDFLSLKIKFHFALYVQNIAFYNFLKYYTGKK